VRDARQDPGIAQKPDQAEVIETRSKSTPGEGEADLVHGTMHTQISALGSAGADVTSTFATHDRAAKLPLHCDDAPQLAFTMGGNPSGELITLSLR
jgi:hypothetical protein